MEIVTITIAVIALIYGVVNHFRVTKLSSKLTVMRDSHYRNSQKWSHLEETTRQSLAKLNYELKKQTGQLKFHKDMTFKDALQINPKVEEVMATMHVGGCPDCAVDLNETLEYGAAKNSVNIEQFLIELNNLPEPDEVKSVDTNKNFKMDPALKIIQ